MKVYGQLELAQVENVTADPVAGKRGRLIYNTTDSKFKIDNGTVYKNLATEDFLTAANITNVPSGNLAADDVQEALNELQTDIDTRATGAQLSTHESDTSTHGVATVAGLSETQVFTNKDYDGGVASNARRMTLPADTLANLNALNRKAGTVVYATDQSKPYVDTGAALTPFLIGSIPNQTVQTRTTTFTASTSDDIYLCSSSGGIYTATLPTPVGNSGKDFVFKKTTNDFNAITISGTGLSTTINTQDEVVRIISDGTNWVAVDRHIPSTWTAYTPSITGWGTISNVNVVWRREGNSIVVRGFVTAGTATAVQLQWGLPSGLTTASSAQIPDTYVCGTVTKVVNAAQNIFPVLISAALTYIRFGNYYAGGTAAGNPGSFINGNDVAVAGNGFLVNSNPIPISGWNS